MQYFRAMLTAGSKLGGNKDLTVAAPLASRHSRTAMLRGRIPAQRALLP